MKKIISILCCVFCLLMPFTAFADEAHFVDYASLVTTDEAQTLSIIMRDSGVDIEFDVRAITINHVNKQGKSIEDFADDYYDINGFGYGANHDGCLFVVNMDDGEWHLSTTGKAVPLTNQMINKLESTVIPKLSNGDYYDAFYSYTEVIHTFFETSNTPDTMSGTAQDAVPNTVSSESASSPVVKSIIYGVVGGNIVALIVIFILVKQLKSVQPKKEAQNYITGSNVTNQKDIFLYRNVTKTRRQTDNTGSAHRSSSGTTHGGGGGRF